MTADQITVFAILGALRLLLVWGRWRYDVVAFLALLAAVVLGAVPAGEAFSGFGHPATVTVAAVLILSRALTRAGATDWIAKAVDPATRQVATHIGALSVLGAVMSSFMNNVGTLGLLMPVALQSAAKAKRSAATILMPLSFGSILGGLVTLIGTPPNIIIATYRGEVLGDAFGMFDFTPVGASVAFAGVAFIALIGWRLVPKAARARSGTAEIFDIDNYVAEAKVPKDSPAAGKRLRDLEDQTKDIDALVVDLVRGTRHYRAAARRETLHAGDVLVIEAGPDEINKFVAALGLELAGGEKTSALRDEDAALVEAVVAPRSRLEGRTVQSQRLLARHGFALLAVARQGTPYRGRLKTFRFRVGDVLLLHGEAERIPEAIAAFGCLPLAERGLRLGGRDRAPALIGIFAAAIAAPAADPGGPGPGGGGHGDLQSDAPARALRGGRLAGDRPAGGADPRGRRLGDDRGDRRAGQRHTGDHRRRLRGPGAGTAAGRHHDPVRRAQQRGDRGGHGAHRGRHRRAPWRKPGSLPHGGRGRRLLRLPDPDRTPEQRPDHGPRRLPLRRLLAHGPAAGDSHRRRRPADDPDRLAAVAPYPIPANQRTDSFVCEAASATARRR
jgi:di/tricarboxylate transporter